MATDNFDFDFKLDFTIEEPVKPVTEQVTQPQMSDMEVSLENSKPFFNPEEHPLQQLDYLEERRRQERLGKKKLVTSHTVGKVKIVYDGVEYKAELKTTMHGDGFKYWQQLYEKEIALARAICYATHVVTYGNYGQVIPPKATEYLTLKEAQILKMQAEQALKEATIDIDAMAVPKQITNK